MSFQTHPTAKRRKLAVVAFSLVLGAAAALAKSPTTTAPGLSLKIPDETVPPGGLAQVKLFITEPKPISTGLLGINMNGVGDLAGISVISPERDTVGVALVSGSRVSVSIVSPTATFGTDSDYPILTIATRVSPTTPVGSVYPIDLDPASLQLTDPSGAVYPNTVKPGSVLVAPNVGIDNVVPGSAEVGAHALVTVIGRGFVPGTKVKFKDVLLSSVSFLDDSHMQVRVAQPARMHGTDVIVVNPNNAQTNYFSYLRTAAETISLRPELRDAVPLFADNDDTTAIVEVAGTMTGLAVQNRQSVVANAVAELFDSSGRPLAAATVRVSPSRFALLELSEVFGMSYAPGQIVRVRSEVPVQVMGVAVDAAGGVRPIPSQEKSTVTLQSLRFIERIE
jgi:hypothetical protein